MAKRSPKKPIALPDFRKSDFVGEPFEAMIDKGMRASVIRCWRSLNIHERREATARVRDIWFASLARQKARHAHG